MSDAMTLTPIVSFIVTVRSGRELLTQTLEQIERCGLSSCEHETFLVRPEAREAEQRSSTRLFPLVAMMVQAYNKGPVSLADAVASARGRYIVLLEEGCFPRPGALSRMIMHFENQPTLGAAVFTIVRPDGSHEGPTYPNVMLSSATGFRRQVLENLPAVAQKLPAAALEYEISLALLASGWEIAPLEDVYATHLQSGAISPQRSARDQGRQLIWLASRHFPHSWVLPFVRDWVRRQRYSVSGTGGEFDYYKGLLAGVTGTITPSHRRPIDEATFEKLTRLKQTQQRLRQAMARHRFSRVLLIDYGVNMLPYWHALSACRLRAVAIADNRLCGKRRHYRGIPIISDDDARALTFDVAIVSNLAPVEAQQRRAEWREFCGRPVLDLFESSATWSAADPRPAAPRIVARSA